jgi:hypothetical protein
MFPDLLPGFYFPFFLCDEDSSLDQVSFVCNHHFDALSAHSDPRAACFRSLASLSQSAPAVLPIILHFFEQLPPEPAVQYAGFHLLSAVFSEILKIESEIAFSIAQHSMTQFLSQSVLLRSGALLILPFASTLLGPDLVSVVLPALCEDSIVRYFATLCLSRILEEGEFSVALESADIQLLLPAVMSVAADFGIPQVLDILSFLLRCEQNAEGFVPFLPDIVRSAFALVQFYGVWDSNHVSVAPGFNFLLSLFPAFNSMEEVQLGLSQLVLTLALEVMSDASAPLNGHFLAPLLELVSNAIFYSPAEFPEVLNCFDVVHHLLDKSTSFALENAIVVLSNICLKYPGNLCPASLPELCDMVVSQHGLIEAVPLVNAVLKLCDNPIELYAAVVTAIVELWESELLNFFDDINVTLTLVCANHMDLLLGLLGDRVESFVDDWLDSCGPRDLIATIPMLASIIPRALTSALLAKVLQVSGDLVRRNSWDAPADVKPKLIEIQRIEVLPFDEVHARFQAFLDSFTA